MMSTVLLFKLVCLGMQCLLVTLLSLGRRQHWLFFLEKKDMFIFSSKKEKVVLDE